MFSLPGLPPLFGDHILVRLKGIDAPEMKAKCPREAQLARDARDLARQVLSEARQIVLRGPERDKYFRILSRVEADGNDLSEMLLNKGLAVPYGGGRKVFDWCAEPSKPDTEESVPSVADGR
jgi:micrococcal nuclease